MTKQRIPTRPKQGTVIHFIMLTETDTLVPFSELLIGLKLPLARPIYPDDNHRFQWDKKTGKTRHNIPITIKMDSFLLLLESMGNNYHSLFEKEHLRKKKLRNQEVKHLRHEKVVPDKTLNIQSNCCVLLS